MLTLMALIMLMLLSACSNTTEGISDIDIRSSDYSIDLKFVGEGFTQSQITAFTKAASKWAAIITADLPSVTLTQPRDVCGFGGESISGVIDDLLIVIKLDDIDGEGKILGAAFPSVVRSSNELTAIGCMMFDRADLSALEKENALDNVILHEMGHVLGIGSFWQPLNGFNSRNLLEFDSDSSESCNATNTFTLKPGFTGKYTNAEYEALGFTGNTPVEDQYGAGTQCSHWDEALFGHELMTGFSDDGAMPLSRLTIASLADLGYQVDYSKADPYTLPPCYVSNCLGSQSPKKYEQWEIVLPPQFTIDENNHIRPLNKFD